MRRILVTLLFVFAVLAAVVLARSFGAAPAPAEPAAPLQMVVDPELVARRLAHGLTYRTISHQDPADFDGEAFAAFQRHLETTYPAVHRSLGRERVNEWSLLYTWEGRSPDLEPLLLLAHQDVVPVEAGTEDAWEHPPYGGVVADGYVWGRGAIDDKGNLYCILEAVERLLARGFRPERTVYLAFGHDEEVGGPNGAKAMAGLLAERGVALDAVLDEGAAIVAGVLPMLERPVALVGVAEKGSVTVELVVEAPGGHSSVPPRRTAIGTLAAALDRLQRHPVPGGIRGATHEFFRHLAPELPLPHRAVLSNLWLFGGVVESVAGRVPAVDAMLRTTTAPTIVEGGVKSNVLPSRARAVVNFRILPGDTWETVVEHVRRTVDDPEVTVSVLGDGRGRNPSPVSPVDSPSFQLLRSVIAGSFEGVPVLPFLVLGGTDSRHFTPISPDVYRFSPFVYHPDDLERIHGTNERVAVDALDDAVRFFASTLQTAAGPRPD